MRIQLVMSQSEVDALDEWRAQNKIWSRSDAIRRLVAFGIKCDVRFPSDEEGGIDPVIQRLRGDFAAYRTGKLAEAEAMRIMSGEPHKETDHA